MKTALVLLLPALLFAQSLKSILEHALNNSDPVLSSRLVKESKAKEAASRKSDYFPKVDIGASYEKTSNTTYFQIRDIYSAYGRVGFDIYDGGAKSALHEKAKGELMSASYDEEALKKSLSLQIVGDFYAIKSLQASLGAKEDERNALQKQLERMKQFYEAKIVTSDDVQRLQASYDKSLYEIESINFEILSAKRSLELKSDMKIDALDESVFKDIEPSAFETMDSIESMSYAQSAIKSGAEAIDSAYYPNVKLQDIYKIYDYKDIPSDHPAKIDRQNTLLLSVDMRIFDYSSAKEAKEALVLRARAMEKSVEYAKKEQKMNYELAISRVKSAKLKIKSAKSAFDAASSAFETIEKKYDAQIVDNVAYLDALSFKTLSAAGYKNSLYELETAKAMLYYYSGKDIKEFVE